MGVSSFSVGVGLGCVTVAAGSVLWGMYGGIVTQNIKSCYKRWCISYYEVVNTSDNSVRSLDERLHNVRDFPHFLRALDDVELLCVTERNSGDAEALNDALEEGGDFTMWKAAYQWSRRARMANNYPSLSAANKLVVGDWLRRAMVEAHVRPSQMIRLLPVAITLTFIKSKLERVMADCETQAARVPGLMDHHGK